MGKRMMFRNTLCECKTSYPVHFTSCYLFVADNTVYDPSSENDDRPAQALSLQRLSNVAEPGLWAFRVDGASILSGGMHMHSKLM